MSNEESNFFLFRDCLSAVLLQPNPPLAPEPARQKRRRHRRKSGSLSSGPIPVPASDPATDPILVDDADELSDFINYLATDIFNSLTPELRNLDYRSWRDSDYLQAQYSLPLAPATLSDSHLLLPPAVEESLLTYQLITPITPSQTFLLPILTSYLSHLTTPPPCTRQTTVNACEICERSWVPLSYHHLIPRFVHDKAVKRGWHRKEDLQNVAWLCGACLRFVHRFGSHEVLARECYTVDMLMGSGEVRRWAEWVGRLRWKGGRTGVRR